jgi:hypothetical protein
MTESLDEDHHAPAQGADAKPASGASTVDQDKSSDHRPEDNRNQKDSVDPRATEDDQEALRTAKDTGPQDDVEVGSKDLQDLSPEPSLDTGADNEQALNEGYDTESNGAMQPTDSEERAKMDTDEGQEPGNAVSTPGSDAPVAPASTSQRTAETEGPQKEDEIAKSTHGNHQGAQVRPYGMLTMCTAIPSKYATFRSTVALPVFQTP